MRVLLIGATSGVMESIARIYAQRGARLDLLARDETRLQELAADLRLRGASSVEYRCFEAADPESCASALADFLAEPAVLDVAIIAHAYLPDQAVCDSSVDAVRRALQVNLVSVIEMLVPLAHRFEQQRQGTIAVFGSVAGDRGRRPNYLYGAAKGAIAVYLQGLRSRMHGHGVHVMTIKPGRMATSMGVRVESAIPAIPPETAARQIVRGILRRREILYVPSWWRFVMWLLCLIPERIFRRFSF